ncbi:uncharacterized protein N7506_011125 [Penicillium brevicompactum]|uniref:uncharacterized protein n=1 Tax=Penicillium brevicompactum TaxID=5074 RepID=UPI0025402C5A|nr:uncharacterized protein N7506_011125 [Penicillium brevicompactum]KAJ5321995.1 hypothetical protein N7506_011125 [Penicillium brevicompactum]
MEPKNISKADKIDDARDISQNKKPEKSEAHRLSIHNTVTMPRELTIQEDPTEPSCLTSPGLEARAGYLSERQAPSQASQSVQPESSSQSSVHGEGSDQEQDHTPPLRLPPHVPEPDSLATDRPDLVRSSNEEASSPPRSPPQGAPDIPSISSPIRLSQRGESDQDDTPTSTHIEFTPEGEIDPDFMRAEMQDWDANPFNPKNSPGGT